VAGGFPPLPREPQDTFSQEVSSALDEGRREIAAVGLRPWRTFLVIDKYDGTRHKQGNLIERELTELDPQPVVRTLSAAEIASSGGVLRSGDVAISQISRVNYTMEQLRGRTLAGDELPDSWDFFYAIQSYGQIHAEFYNLASTPVLGPTAWRLTLRPRNKRAALVIGPD
jgi:hypothetical protein